MIELIGVKVNREVGLQNLITIKTHWSFLAKGRLTMEQVYELPDQLRRGPILVFAKGATLYYSCLYNLSPLPMDSFPEKINSVSSIHTD